ncbi:MULTISPECIES: crotonase/enoyl-CoA hydratase family protein [Halomonadaceae]|uniref:Crotonase/enoyl-CoA hydratase family protein n=1 Tax=Vreelandella halophila TaxID=86177 RepID=A0A9X4YEF1_9GAMM|nr:MULTISPECIES: crotonase/enoyl-CoA hydratase family protein [Halomonas]MYL27708.1 crotonase/enoyl-CoA hydratase family protein [Halomonas utahensis]MYL75438.1 crotonase/enoyl-CoA hydratase family protein [Halomonas sp. 22501_18_FS]
MSDRVTLEIDNDIAYVTLNRPDKYNGLDMAMFDAIASTAKTLKKDRSIRAVIIQGAGKAFCSGLDVKSVSANPVNFAKLLFKPGRKISNLAQDVGYLWREVPAPVIAVTHGVCYGGGLQIALGADFRYSTRDCEFSIMEAKWGLIPDMSITTTLSELMPIDKAKELTMTARVVEAPEAERLGMVTHVSDTPLDDALAFVEELKAKSPDAVAATKLLYNRAWQADDRTALGWESRLQKKIIARANQRTAVARNTGKPEQAYDHRRSF